MASFEFRKTYGAELTQDGQTLFTVWAPSKRSISVEIEGLGTFPLQPAEHGLFQTKVRCSAGARYRFALDTGEMVSDPASRYQPEGVLGPSEVINPNDYDWQNPHWLGRPWNEAVIYELHVGLMGDYDGIITKLDELRELGITAIELMPLNSFGGSRNWGYDGVLPYAPSNTYGHPNDLKSLIDAAHARGIMVILDVVYNHFGPEGNFLPLYAEDFFDHDNNSTWGTGIAFATPPVARFFTENVLYWLMEYRFDGIRIDAASAISDRHWFYDVLQRVKETVPPECHVHLILENENNDSELLRDGYTAQWNDDGHNSLHVLLTGEHEGYYEMFSKNPTEDLATVLSEGFAYQGKFNPYSGKNRGSPSKDLNQQKFIFFLQNHDQTGNRALGERLVSLANSDAVKAAYALVLLSPMIPMIFMGEEWGCTTPFYFFCDFRGKLGNAVKEGRFREFEKFSSFKDHSERSKIPDPNALQTYENSRPDRSMRDTPEGQAWLELTTKCLELRKKYVSPFLSHIQTAQVDIRGLGCIWVKWCLTDQSNIVLVINISEKNYTLNKKFNLIFSTNTHASSENIPTNTLLFGREICS